MIVEGIVWCMGSMSQKSGDESESAAYELARQSFWILERAYRYNVWARLMGDVEVYRMESWIFGNWLWSCRSAKWAVVSIIIYWWLRQRPSIQKSAGIKHPIGGNGWFVWADLRLIQHKRSISPWKDELDARGFANWGWKTASSRWLKNACLPCPGQYFSSTKTNRFASLKWSPINCPYM